MLIIRLIIRIFAIMNLSIQKLYRIVTL